MDTNNFFGGLRALVSTARLSLDSLLINQGMIGFFGGIVLTILVTLFVITKDPQHIPLILRLSTAESFQRITTQNKKGSYELAFVNFIKIYSRVRWLSLLAFTAFCVMITAIALSK